MCPSCEEALPLVTTMYDRSLRMSVNEFKYRDQERDNTKSRRSVVRRVGSQDDTRVG